MDKELLNIDTRFRDRVKYPSSGRFTLSLNTPIKNVTAITLISIEFPNVYYQISAKRGNHQFYLNTTLIQLQDGNYSVTQILDTLTLQMTNVVSDISVTIFSTESKLLISSEANTFTLDFGPLYTSNGYPSLGYLLGFRNSVYTAVPFVKSESIPYVNPEHYFFLRLNDYGRIGMQMNENQVFAKIINPTSKADVLIGNISSSFFNTTHLFRQPVDIGKFDIEILDAYGQTIDLMDSDYSFTLEIETVYNSYVKKSYESSTFYPWSTNGGSTVITPIFRSAPQG